MKKITWPNGKRFAFTIVDDTDCATVSNVKPIYDYLFEKGIITTKTVWVYPPRDIFAGECLSDDSYLQFIKDLHNKGYEIGFHSAGSGAFLREETITALEKMHEMLGEYPTMHINHADNNDSIYWGGDRFSPFFKNLYKKLKKSNTIYEGVNKDKSYFWGDICKKRIKYIRNMVFKQLNTLKNDRYMPYREASKDEYSNFWFSASYGINKEAFVRLLSKKNIDKLVHENGCAIVYTHFAFEFVDENGNLDEEFKRCIDYLADQNGWFIPATPLLDYLHEIQGKDIYLNALQAFNMNLKWFYQRIFQKY